MTFNMICVLLASFATGVAGFAVGVYFIEQKFKKEAEEQQVWNTDPGVHMPHFEKAVKKGYADLKIMQEHERRKMNVRTYAENKIEREIASGMVIDPGGQPHCRRCGHTVSAVSDRCQQCFNALNWNA